MPAQIYRMREFGIKMKKYGFYYLFCTRNEDFFGVPSKYIFLCKLVNTWVSMTAPRSFWIKRCQSTNEWWSRANLLI